MIPTIPTPTAPADPLRDAASVSGKMIGTAVQLGLLRTPQYDTVAARHFNYLTAEYEMKMGGIAQPKRNSCLRRGDHRRSKASSTAKNAGLAAYCSSNNNGSSAARRHDDTT